MLSVRRRTLDIKLEPREFAAVVKTIATDGWLPAINQSRNTFYDLASVPGERRADLSQPSRRLMQIRGGDEVDVEVFFTDEAGYVLTCTYDEIGMRFDPEHAETEGTFVTIAQVGASGVNPDEIVKFSEDLVKAIKKNVDGRRSRHWTYEWKERVAETSRLDQLNERLGVEGATLVFNAPDMTESAEQASGTLQAKSARQLLIELSQAGFARETDILSKRGQKADEVKGHLSALNEANLILTEHLLQCKMTSAPLTRLTNPEQLADGQLAELRCVNCNRKFSEERLSEGYSVSPVGRSMIQGSHWMTVWVTRVLLDLGVPESAIRWNMEESGEEVDIVFEYLDRLWIVELKDRDFGAGDAHPFNYRRVRYRAEEAVVVSTGKVSTDARRVFRDLTQGAGRARRNEQLTLIEGLESVASHLSKRFDDAALIRTRSTLRVPSMATGYDLVEIFARRAVEGAPQARP